MLQIQKQTNASGGFKVPQESIDKRISRNKPQFSSDLPSKNELFSQLGIQIDDDASMDHNIGRGNMVQVAKRMIQEKSESIRELPPKPTPVVSVKKSIPISKLTSEDIEQMLEKHRKEMEPLHEKYMKQRMNSSSPRSFQEKKIKKNESKSPKTHSSVRVTYHDTLDAKKDYRDASGPHGQFLKEVIPKTKQKQFEKAKQIVHEDDFQRKFKKYLRNKKKHVLDSDDEQVEFDLYASTSPNPDRQKSKHHHKAYFKDKTKGSTNNSTLGKSTSRKKQRSQSVEDEQFMIEQFFKQIDKNDQNVIDKIATIKYIVANPQIMDAFNIHPKELNNQINKFPTKDPNSLNLKEFSNFLKSFKHQVNHESFGGLSHVQQKQMQSGCLLSQQILDKMKQVFEEMQNDMVAPKNDLIQALRNDINVVRELHKPAAYVASIDKVLTLDKVLSHIDTQETQFISWKQFLDAFEYDNTVSKQQVSFAQLRDTNKQNDMDKIDSPKELQDLIHELIKAIIEDGYINTQTIVDSIRRTPLYSSLRKQVVRKSIPKPETLEQLLERIEEQAHDYLTEPEFMSYFTRRGQPQFEEEVASLAKSVNVTEAYLKGDGIDGYDSDPELHTYQDKLLPRQRFLKSSSSQNGLLTYSHRKANKSNKSLPRQKDEEFLKSIMPRHGDFGAHTKPSDYQFKVTVPEPYQFDQREKERSLSIRAKKVQEMIDEKRKSEKFSPFRAKEVPHHVKEPLFEKIMNDNQKRREQVKKDSMKLTLQSEKPFSFHKRQPKAPRRKHYWEREKFAFKAKGIPWHVHVNLLQQMREDEEIKRQERIAKHAQELAMNSRMPARMEQHERQKQAQQPSPKYQKPQVVIKAKQMPDFERLHSTFQESLNRKKSQMRTTDPIPFNFQQSHRGVDRDYLDLENTQKVQPPKEDKILEARKKMEQKPIKQPPSTKKFDGLVEERKKYKEKKRLEEESKKKEERERLERKEKFKQVFHQHDAIKEGKKSAEEQRKEQIQKKLKEQREIERKQKAVIEQCKESASKQPYLLERKTKRDEQLEKMKQLSKMNKIMTANGVTNKDAYFDQKEKDMLADMEYLKKHGYEDDFE